MAIKVIVDQNAARRAGVSSEDIANALNSQLTGVEVTDYRVGDIVIPVVMRAQGEQRQNIDRFRTLNIAVAGSTPVPLSPGRPVRGASTLFPAAQAGSGNRPSRYQASRT